MPHDAYKALYIHIPFCASRCAYCDFATEAEPGDSRRVERYAEGVVADIRRLSREGELAQIETVYLGGGTPTHIARKHLSAILYALGCSMHLTPEVECTVEANPESTDERLIADIWALGANRISIGVQSFDDGVLRTLGRAHDAARAEAAVRAAQTRFANVSVDLMCGIPGQTAGSFASDVSRACDLGVVHVSVYPLTIEEGTPFFRQMMKGKMPPPDEDVQADMMEDAARILADAGFARYEVANYAKPGFESRHNTAYWSGKPYLGIGRSAATCTQNETRRMRVTDGAVTDDLDERQMAAEDLMLAMRMARGVDEARVARLADTLLPEAAATFSDLEGRGLVRREDGRFKPTERGWLLGNELYGALLDLAP